MNNYVNRGSWVKWAKVSVWHFHKDLDTYNKQFIAECGHSVLPAASQRSQELPGANSDKGCPKNVCQNCYNSVKLKPSLTSKPTSLTRSGLVGDNRSEAMSYLRLGIEDKNCIPIDEHYDPLDGEKISDFSAEWRDDGDDS